MSFHFRMPRAHDPRRGRHIREWADSERQAARLGSPLGWRERVVYSAIALAVLAVVFVTVVRIL
jgi:hypothetical protein